MKLCGFLLLALILLAVTNAGCVGFIRDTYRNYASPVPSPTLIPTPTSTPINQTVERQYMFAEKLMAGLEDYNSAIRMWNASRMDANSMNWANATQEIGLAKTYMEQARSDFLGVKPYAATPDENLVWEKWNETAYYQIQAFGFVDLSYQEAAYQASRSFAEQNPIKYNYYVSQANEYISLAKQSRAEAEAAERRTFIGQQGQVISG